MKLLGTCCFLFFILNISVNALDNKSLVAVHIIFRHGNRSPELSNFYPNSQYSNESYFKPNGFGQLTNKGKLTAYNLGLEIRKRYTGFLDESYNIKLINARSTDFNRTKASLQAVLAGLFPPTEELNWLPGFNWQPIATTYFDRRADPELFCFGCPNWNRTINNYILSEGKNKFLIYKNVIEFLTNKTYDYNGILQAYYLYNGFEILTELNYTLPEWAKNVYPYPLKNLTMDYYDMITATSRHRQMAGGYLMKHILQDIQEKIDGKYPNKKMYLWSGHKNNIVSVLSILKLWSRENTLKYCSYIALELHNVNGIYGLQVLYKFNASGPVILQIPNCDVFCPLEKLKLLIQSDIPSNDSVCRGTPSSANSVAVSVRNIVIFIVSLYCINLNL